MNIYESEGTDAIVDLRAAAHELRASSTITHDATRRAAIAEIQTAALLDIALSLRVVAADARQGIADAFADLGVEEAPEPAGPRTPIVGDVVARAGANGFPTGPALGHLIDVVVSEGAYVGVVQTPNDDVIVRTWLEELAVLEGDEGDEPDPHAEVIVEAGRVAEMAGVSHIADEPDGYEIPEEADEPEPEDDFESERPATALDALKADEKAAKKGKKK